ncbi:MAG: polysaccharide deacetylase family protein [Leptolyngbya sp. SIO1D8]|nr:polysaccharide deacetylase family protein [Leptolyngbya sp. SIO1D8]
MQPLLKAPSSLPSWPKRPRRWLQYCAITLVIALLITIWEPYLWSNRYRVAWIFGEAIYKVQTSEKVVALTFDDGPDPRYTQQISQLLADAGARSTFFVIGRHAEQYPDLIDTLIQQGHELGNHTWSHPSLRLMLPGVMRAELESTDRLLHSYGYESPIPFRSPYGHSWFVLPQILKLRRQPNILWTVQLNDWKPEKPSIMMDLLETKFDNGAIILLHDGDGESEGADRANTVEVVKLILEKYIPQGYQFVTVSELLHRGKPLHFQ